MDLQQARPRRHPALTAFLVLTAAPLAFIFLVLIVSLIRPESDGGAVVEYGMTIGVGLLPLFSIGYWVTARILWKQEARAYRGGDFLLLFLICGINTPVLFIFGLGFGLGQMPTVSQILLVDMCFSGGLSLVLLVLSIRAKVFTSIW